MRLSEFLRAAQSVTGKRQARRVTHRDAADLMRVSHRTYVEYVRGVNNPKGMSALLHLLAQLHQDDLLDLLNRWRRRHAKECEAENIKNR